MTTCANDDEIGPATRETVETLHRELARDLVRRIKRRESSAAVLHVARMFLADQRPLGESLTAADRRKLQGLYRLLLEALHAAVTGPTPPSAAVLSEVRHFLRDQGISKDLGGAISKAEALEVLGAASLPFINVRTQQ
jgi:hypothetical protein